MFISIYFYQIYFIFNSIFYTILTNNIFNIKIKNQYDFSKNNTKHRIDPHEQQQRALILRIAKSVDRLSSVVGEVNQVLKKSEESHEEIDYAYKVWNKVEDKMAVTLAAGNS